MKQGVLFIVKLFYHERVFFSFFKNFCSEFLDIHFTEVNRFTSFGLPL